MNPKDQQEEQPPEAKGSSSSSSSSSNQADKKDIKQVVNPPPHSNKSHHYHNNNRHNFNPYHHHPRFDMNKMCSDVLAKVIVDSLTHGNRAMASPRVAPSRFTSPNLILQQMAALQQHQIRQPPLIINNRVVNSVGLQALMSNLQGLGQILKPAATGHPSVRKFAQKQTQTDSTELGFDINAARLLQATGRLQPLPPQLQNNLRSVLQPNPPIPPPRDNRSYSRSRTRSPRSRSRTPRSRSRSPRSRSRSFSRGRRSGRRYGRGDRGDGRKKRKRRMKDKKRSLSRGPRDGKEGKAGGSRESSKDSRRSPPRRDLSPADSKGKDKKGSPSKDGGGDGQNQQGSSPNGSGSKRDKGKQRLNNIRGKGPPGKFGGRGEPPFKNGGDNFIEHPRRGKKSKRKKKRSKNKNNNKGDNNRPIGPAPGPPPLDPKDVKNGNNKSQPPPHNNKFKPLDQSKQFNGKSKDEKPEQKSISISSIDDIPIQKESPVFENRKISIDINSCKNKVLISKGPIAMELETDEENEKNDIDDEEDDLGKSSKNLIEVVAFNNGNGQDEKKSLKIFPKFLPKMNNNETNKAEDKAKDNEDRDHSRYNSRSRSRSYYSDDSRSYYSDDDYSYYSRSRSRGSSYDSFYTYSTSRSRTPRSYYSYSRSRSRTPEGGTGDDKARGSRSPPRRRSNSPSFMDKRRITSARKRPIVYDKYTSRKGTLVHSEADSSDGGRTDVYYRKMKRSRRSRYRSGGRSSYHNGRGRRSPPIRRPGGGGRRRSSGSWYSDESDRR